GLETSLEIIREKPFDIYNVVGIKNGTNLNDQIIIICSHYDIVEGSPGADDAALGVAATLEIARLLKDCELNRTVYFLSLPEHSFPMGTDRWIEMHPELRENIIGVIGLDQIGYGDKLRILYIPQNAWLADLVQRSGNGLNISIDKQISVACSDYEPFMQINIPAVMLIELNFTPYHHKPGDTIETLNFSLAEDATKTAIESIHRLATPCDTEPPVVNILRPSNMGISGTNTIPLTYNISADDAQVQVFLDGENLGDIKSRHWLTLTKGQHDLEVWATDECGNTGRDTASFEVDVYVLNALNSDTKSNRSLKILIIGLFAVLLMIIIIMRYKRNDRRL
ncbi:MAG: M28 family peptidase, partial [Euryarchaeota archaeon]|nr:M28 family peptidase [Euryarchaeota archaeon]